MGSHHENTKPLYFDDGDTVFAWERVEPLV